MSVILVSGFHRLGTLLGHFAVRLSASNRQRVWEQVLKKEKSPWSKTQVPPRVVGKSIWVGECSRVAVGNNPRLNNANPLNIFVPSPWRGFISFAPDAPPPPGGPRWSPSPSQISSPCSPCFLSHAFCFFSSHHCFSSRHPQASLAKSLHPDLDHSKCSVRHSFNTHIVLL